MPKDKDVSATTDADAKDIADKKAKKKLAKQNKKIAKLEEELQKAAKRARKRARAAKAAQSNKKTVAVSPLAPPKMPKLPEIDGVRFAVAQAGVKYAGRDDVMLVELAPGTALAGTFTRSATRAACVLDAQTKLAAGGESDKGAAILVNSGNANAFTGAAGAASVDRLCAAVAATLGVPQERVLTSSTGVIGEPLPDDKIAACLETLRDGLDPAGAARAARAIMTTDTFPKAAKITLDLEEGPVTIVGIAKGSGMIAPDMATMLAYVFTDAKISAASLQKIVSTHVETSFNAITVDSDTSTSDALMVAATGRSGVAIEDLRTRSGRRFNKAVGDIMRELAQLIVRDGEGATKFVEIQVTGAASKRDAKTVAMAVANSPLVKTAIAGEDANWGRIVAAVGKSGAKADRDLLSIRFGDVVVAEKGQRAPDYDEDVASAYMRKAELVIGVDLGLGAGKATVWTCDLTHGYIDINADYRS